MHYCIVNPNCSIFNPTALRKAKTEYNFGLSECNRVKTVTVIIIPVFKVFTVLSKRHLKQMQHFGLNNILFKYINDMLYTFRK